MGNVPRQVMWRGWELSSTEQQVQTQAGVEGLWKQGGAFLWIKYIKSAKAQTGTNRSYGDSREWARYQARSELNGKPPGSSYRKATQFHFHQNNHCEDPAEGQA